MNIFEQASFQKLRYQSARGELTTEQLWDIPLQSKSLFDLDNIAKSINLELKNVSDESFVSQKSNPAKDTLSLKLEILKHIISVKLKEQETRANAARRKEEKEKLLTILAEKQTESLRSLSAEELMAKINAMD